MNFISGLFIGLIIGGAGVWFLMREKTKEKEIQPEELENAKNFNPAVAVKNENLVKLEQLITQKTSSDKITNDEVQKLLNVSDATAERYLNELEKQGKISQIGGTGYQVYYQKR